MEKWRDVFSNRVLLVCVVLQTATRVKGKACPPCGPTPVPFPFSTAGNCGDPLYKIRCSAGNFTLFFDTANNSYVITSISPSSQRLIIYPSFLGYRSCITFDLSSGGIQLNPSLPFSLTTSNTIMLLNCTSNVLQSPLNCSSNSLCHLEHRHSCRPLPFCCTLQAGHSASSHSIELISPELCRAYVLVTVLSTAILLSIIGFLLYGRQRRLHLARETLAKEREQILNLNNTSGRSAKKFTCREVKNATNNFSHENLLGIGGYGEVYKGVLQDGTLIAVKCAKIGNTKSTDQVLNEVRILSQVNHRSLVRLLGCCVELDRPLMVYEFISNGTLADHLHGFRSPLSWRHRLSIAHQTAEGLAYLHFLAMPPIYHRDVKSTNILLDENLNAKVTS